MLKTIMKKRNNKKKGFTLAELVIVVAIIAILTGLAVMVFGNITDSANNATFQSNHRSVVSGVVMAVAENDGSTDGLTTAAIDKYVADKSGVTGVTNLDGSPKGSTYAVSIAGDVVTVTSTYDGTTLTYNSK